MFNKVPVNVTLYCGTFTLSKTVSGVFQNTSAGEIQR